MQNVRILPLWFALLLLLAAGAATADTWHTITSGWRPSRLITTPEGVFAASDGGLVKMDPVTLESNILNKDDGFFSNDVSVIAINPDSTELWIGHANAAIERYDFKNEVILQRILNFYDAPEVFEVYDIVFNDNAAFIATDIGVSKCVMEEVENVWIIQENYRSFGSWDRPTKATRLFCTEEKLLVGTEFGLAIADYDDNLIHEAAWELYELETTFGVPADTYSRINTLDMIDGTIYIGVYLKGVFKYDWQTFTRIGPAWLNAFGFTKGPNDHVYAGLYNGLYQLNETGTDWEAVDPTMTQKIFDLNYSQEKFWCTLDTDDEAIGGMATYAEDEGWQLILSNTPGGNEVNSSALAPNGDIWITGKGEGVEGGFRLRDGIWDSFTRLNGPDSAFGYLHQAIGFDMFGGTWLGSRGNALLYIEPFDTDNDGEFDTDSVRYFDSWPETGARLGDTWHEGQFVLIGDIVSAPDSGLWITNPLADYGYPLHYVPKEWLKATSAEREDIPWVDFHETETLGTEYQLGTIFINIMEQDQQGRLWFAPRSDIGPNPLIMFDPNGTPEDKADDLVMHLDFNNGVDWTSLLTMKYAPDGSLWLGGTSGLYYLDTTVQPDRFYVTKVYGAVGQSIKAIDIDPQGQIWVGTDYGVSVLGSDKFTWVRHYTSESGPHPSPLVDDQVNAITFDPKTGDAYLGTTSGLSIVTTPFREFGDELGDIEVRPQPFFAGPNETTHLTFVGESLVPDAIVKIFTPSGRLIRELTFEQASSAGWDGKREDGDWASSGVYLIVVTDPQGESKVGKAAMIRR